MEKLPADYEACGTCGFDHEYEPNEAAREHRKEQSFDDNQFEDEYPLFI